MIVITSSYWSQSVFFCFTFTILGCYLYLMRNFNYWRKLGVKFLQPSLLFGNIGACIIGRKSPQGFVEDIYHAHEKEKLLGFYAIDRPYLLVRDPEFVKHILVRDFHNFTNKVMCGNEYDQFGSEGIFMADKLLWTYLRTKLTWIFTSGKLKKMFDLMLEIGEDFQSYSDGLKIDEKNGKDIEVREFCAKLTTDFIGITAFGLKLHSLIHAKTEFRKHGKSMFRSDYKRYLEMLAIFFVPVLRHLTRPKLFESEGSQFLTNTFWHVINERIKTGNKRNDLIDLLIELKNNRDISHDFKLEGNILVAQAGIFFAGGFETSSSTMSFALYELSKNQEIQNKLRSEVLNAADNEGGKMTYNMVSTLPYLNMVVHETLRMYPVVAWIDRIPENDYTFDGTNITVQKDIPFLVSIRGLQMDPKYFPNPEEFIPERFSDENKRKIVPFTYLPFGKGPRGCIGKRLGILQLKLGLIYFITRFDITVCKETPIPMQFSNTSLSLKSSEGLYLNFKELRSNKN